MPDINSLASRIDAEFSAVEQKVKKLQTQKVEEHKQRQQRLEQLGKVFDELRDVWSRAWNSCSRSSETGSRRRPRSRR